MAKGTQCVWGAFDMNQKKLILAGGLVVVAGGVFVMLNGLGGDAPAPVLQPETKIIKETVDYTKVLSVSSAMNKGDRLDDKDLMEIDWPTDALTDALIVVDDDAEVPVIDQLVGSFVRAPIQPGEPLTYGKFIRAGEAGIMAALLKPGMRATTIRISTDTAAGGFIQPGDKVDVVLKEAHAAIPRSEGGSGKPTITANTIFKNVSVLAIDQNYANNPDGGAAVVGSTATLELSLEDSEALMVSQDKGDLFLLLRGFSGSGASGTSHAQKPQIATLRIPPLVVVRKGEVETVQLQQR